MEPCHTAQYGLLLLRPYRFLFAFHVPSKDLIMPDYRRYRVSGGTYFFPYPLLPRHIRYVEKRVAHVGHCLDDARSPQVPPRARGDDRPIPLN